jgi:tetratricopeptide (TPR) repeat protein
VKLPRFKVPALTRKSTLFRLAGLFLVGGLILSAPAGVLGYRLYTSRPTYLAEKGAEALERGDATRAKQFADLLHRKGHESAAHILRGKIFLHEAKSELEKAPLHFPYEGVQRTGQMVLSAAGLAVYPPALRGLGWLAAIQVQQPFEQQIFGVEQLLDALGEFTQVLDNDPWGAEATVLAAECLARLGDYPSAQLALNSLVDRQPDNLEAHRWLTAIYIEVNATTLAANHLREWIRLAPNDPRPYRSLSQLTRYSESGYSEAIECYDKLLHLNLDSGERAAVLKDLADTQIAAQGEYQQALDTLAEIPAKFQEQPPIVLLRAECILGLGRADEAKALVDGVLKGHPMLTGALIFRARIHIQDDQPRLAIPLLEKVLSLHPDNRRALQTLMLAYRSIGDDRQAEEKKRLLDQLQTRHQRIEELRKVAIKHPANGRARLELALLYSPANYAEALAWIRYAMASDPEDPRIRKTWTQLVGYQPPPLLRDFQRRRQGKP